jgi:hypothetical protein
MSLQKTAIVLARHDLIVSTETLRLWELNLSEPRVSQFFLLCNVLRVSPAALLTPESVD